MHMLDILDKICESIATTFTEAPIYIMNCPEGFKRPSFLVKMIGFNDSDMTRNTSRRQIAYQIVYFSPKDDYNIPDAADQLSTHMTMANIFEPSRSLPVKDRYIKIVSVDGGPRDAEVYFNIKFDFSFVPEALSPQEMYEITQGIQIKYNPVGGN